MTTSQPIYNQQDVETVLHAVCQVFSSMLDSTHDLVDGELPATTIDRLWCIAMEADDTLGLSPMQKVFFHEMVSKILHDWASLNQSS